MYSHAVAKPPYGLGLSPSEFWAMTPREYRLHKRRFRQHRVWEDMQHAHICAIVASHSMSPPIDPVTVDQYMLTKSPKHRVEQAAKEQSKEQSIDEQNQAFFHALLPFGNQVQPSKE